MASLQEGIALLAQQHFGRRTEKLSEMPGQMSLIFDSSDAFNEAEVLTENGMPEELSVETVVVRRKAKTKGKREADLSGIETVLEPMAIISFPMKSIKIWNTSRLNSLCMSITSRSM
ncbi:transposase domain-containing protein [Anaerocolumna jejuensis]|uniref:transposase domain-containing protein n=1 Tax=Anaerocolumna jejuensis TaxID=259063 RepID=UPI003F7BC2FC